MIATDRQPNDCDFLSKVGDHLWITIQPLPFSTRYGQVIVPMGFKTDLFSVVPDTRYPDFWKASILHDFCCRSIDEKQSGRVIQHLSQAHLVFYDEMLVQSAVIFSKLQEQSGMEFSVEEFRKLLRVSRLYYRGVAGIFGWLYRAFVD